MTGANGPDIESSLPCNRGLTNDHTSFQMPPPICRILFVGDAATKAASIRPQSTFIVVDCDEWMKDTN